MMCCSGKLRASEISGQHSGPLCFSNIKHQTHTGGAGCWANKGFEFHAKVRTDIKTLEVRINSGIYNIKTPKQYKDQDRIIHCLAVTIPVIAERFRRNGLQIIGDLIIPCCVLGVFDSICLPRVLVSLKVIKEDSCRNSQCRVDNRNFPILLIVDLSPSWYEGRTKGSFTGIVNPYLALLLPICRSISNCSDRI